MKALHKMDNLDEAELLCKLFPEQIKNIQNAIKNQCHYFLQNETAFRDSWHQGGFITADFWYRLVQTAHKEIERNRDNLHKRPRSFADHLFDGHNSLFALHCLIEYADTEECNGKLKDAIHLLFGSHKVLKTTPD